MAFLNMGLSKTVSARALIGLAPEASLAQLGTSPQVIASSTRSSELSRTTGTASVGATL
jgi:hypothetical protein